MLKKLVKLGLAAGLSVASLNADTFQKGDNVIVKKGSIMCFAKESYDATAALKTIDLQMDLYASDAKDGSLDSRRMPKILGNLYAEYCINYNADYSWKFEKYYSESKYAILKSENGWYAVYSSSFKKDTSTPKVNKPNYSSLGIDDLEAFPSDYIGKLSFLKCKRSTPEEMKNGGYKIMSTCAKADGSYGFGGNNPFKIQIQTSSRDVARAIAKSKRQEKWFLGTVKKNTEQFTIAKHIFVINEVHYK